MSDALQRCLSISDAYGIIVRSITQMFVNQSGALYILDTDHNQAEAVATWGEEPPEKLVFAALGCQALQSGQRYIVDTSQTAMGCTHVSAPAPFAYMCIPLVAHGETLGILHLRHPLPLPSTARERWEHLAITMADHISLALANLYLRRQLHEQSIRDALTGLFNRRYLEETLRRELCQAVRHNRTVGVIILDIDYFKRFNDTYGHHAGDTVLQAVGMFLQANIRGGDIACRYGGEEFILILPEATLEDTHRRAEQLRHNIKHLRVNYQNQQLPVITLSLGVASFPQHGDVSEAIIRSADDALYCAKAHGRDCVMVAR
jgi:diguanylate cyclase (GGDEF)-like protein